MKPCVNCGAEFAPQKNAKTCSPGCSKAYRAKRERTYAQANADIRRIRTNLSRTRGVIARVKPNRKIDRAVRLLFALTRSTHDDQR